MTKKLREAGPLKVTQSPSDDGSIPLVLITTGWGSSGYYSESVLKNAASNGLFSEGLQMYIDHPGATESFDRPERSIRDLAAVLSTSGTYDESQKGIVAWAKPVGLNAEMLKDKDFLEAIGVSIRAYGDSTIGEAEGRRGQLITELTEAVSVDFVTKAGRGGRVLVDLMESARPEQVVDRAIGSGVQEATANETRNALQASLTAQYGGEKSWVWVRDFDETNVWFELETPDGTGIYQDSYEIDEDSVATTTGSPVEVVIRTSYVPVSAQESETHNVPAPAGRVQKEINMGNIQVDEAEYGRITEASGRVPTLEAERDAANARAESAEQALRLRDARDTARTIISTESTATGVTFTDLEVEGLLARVSLGESGFDAAAFTTVVKDTCTKRAEAATPARVTGFGSFVDAGTDGDQSVIKAAESAAASAFGRTIKEN